jgi:hypothetical protein
MRDSSVCKVKILGLLLCLSVGLAQLSSYAFCALGEKDDALSKIEDAEKLICQAFEGVLEAEGAGANVSSLLVQLDSAGSFIDDARMRYRSGDFAGALQSANASIQSVEGFAEKVEQLKVSAANEYKERAFQIVATSGMGILVVILVTMACWLLIKRRYYRNVLNMKPEVVANESRRIS